MTAIARIIRPGSRPQPVRDWVASLHDLGELRGWLETFQVRSRAATRAGLDSTSLVEVTALLEKRYHQRRAELS